MIDEKLQKLSKEDPLAIRRAMVHPEHFELLVKGEMKYWESTCTNVDEESSSNEDVEEESIHDSAINSVNKTLMKKESFNCTKRRRRRNMYEHGVERPNVPFLLRDSISNCSFINID